MSGLNPSLTVNEFMMLRSLLKTETHVAGRMPFWKIAGKWSESLAHIIEAEDACELLVSNGFAEAVPGNWRNRVVKVYSLSDRGRSFIETVNANGHESLGRGA